MPGMAHQPPNLNDDSEKTWNMLMKLTTVLESFNLRLATLLIAILLCGVVTADDRIDDVMYQDPAFPVETTLAEFSDKLKPLWLQALNRPESELQRLAADTIALAHRSGMPGLADTADKLMALLQQEKLEPTVRNAVARALVTLDAKQAAKTFAEAMQSGSLELGMIVEPALANWDYAAARETWRQRLDNPATERERLLLAIDCLGTVQDVKATAAMLAIVTDVNAEFPTRMAAARGAASINDDALLDVATELTGKDEEQPTARMLAATLLTSQTSANAVSILKQMATDPSPVVSGLALRRLFEIDPTNVYEFAGTAIGSKDLNVRRVACEAFVHQSDADAISLLGPVLDDPNPSLRYYVSQSLIQLAERESLRPDVIQASINVVSVDDWRGLEKAIIILGTLDHEPIAPRFFELMDHRRPEVAVAAAWGLRKLAIVETLPDLFTQAEKRTNQFLSKSIEGGRSPVLDAQLCQLFQAFGEMDYAEPEDIMRRFIPKETGGPITARPAAVWAMGKLHEGHLDERLANLLSKRLSDTNPLNPELLTVRRMSAIALGRMNAKSHLGTLRQYVEEAPNMAGQGCIWSLQRMTGEVHEYPLVRPVESSEWFLRPR